MYTEDFLTRRGSRRRNGTKSFLSRFFFFIFFLILIIGGEYIWWTSQLTPVNAADSSQKKFIVSSGEGIKTIADNLYSSGLIRNQLAFYILVKKLGLNGKLQAGEFELSPSMSAGQVAEQLRTGTFDVWVTIPEGKRAEEIADILKDQLPGYQDNWRALLVANEGYLFPSKYRFPRDVSIETVISIMKKEFQANYNRLNHGEKDVLSMQEIVTIASLVEREAKFAEDRPLIASVILNRLDGDIKLLNIDSTIQYSLGYQSEEHTWWKRHLTADDLQLDSLYNTYIHSGLPPTPICNPGYDSLVAVVNAPKTAYLYYISDQSGHNHYAKTLDEHNKNVRKYGLQ